MQVRDGPAAVRGDAPPPRGHWPAARWAGKAVGEGALSQKTCLRSAHTEPLAEGEDQVLYRWLVSLALSVAALSLLVPGATGGRTAGSADFPITITAGNGKVTIRKQPERVISLSPTATESLFAIGAGKQVIAVDDQSDYPKERALRRRCRGFTPNVEAIAALVEPDLVVVVPTTRRGSSTRSNGSASRSSSTTPRGRSRARISRFASSGSSPGSARARPGSSP